VSYILRSFNSSRKLKVFTGQVIDELDRIKAAGFKAIFLTVDNTGINGIRTRAMRYTAGSE
jgi:uncharacterized lipoprotein YddW (UPF0748 family)